MTLLLFFALGSTVALAGSGGIRNGAIQGVVYDETGSALAGVSVVAVRETDPPIIRSTATDAQGQYFLQDMYLGNWVLGFSKFGFKTLDTTSGDPANRTALGDQVRVFIWTGQLVTAPAINLQPEFSSKQAQVSLEVIDGTSGLPVTHATVVSGTSSVFRAGADDRYALDVLIRFDEAGGLIPTRISIMAEGFMPSTVELPIGASDTPVPLNATLDPTLITLVGQVRLPSPSTGAEYDSIRVQIINLDPGLTQGTVRDFGLYSLRAPSSTTQQVREYDLQFTAPGFRPTHRGGVRTPEVGSLTILPEIVMERDPEETPEPNPEP